MTLDQINSRREILLSRLQPLVKLKKQITGPIDTPMTDREKKLSRVIAEIFSQINYLTKLKRNQ